MPSSVLSRLAGLRISRTHPLRPATRMRTRSMYRQNIEARLKHHEKRPRAEAIGWTRYVTIHATTRTERCFWLPQTRSLHDPPFLRAHVNRVLGIDLNTDAGGRCWGAVPASPQTAGSHHPCFSKSYPRASCPTLTVQAVASALCMGLTLCWTFTDAVFTERRFKRPRPVGDEVRVSSLVHSPSHGPPRRKCCSSTGLGRSPAGRPRPHLWWPPQSWHPKPSTSTSMTSASSLTSITERSRFPVISTPLLITGPN